MAKIPLEKTLEKTIELPRRQSEFVRLSYKTIGTAVVEGSAVILHNDKQYMSLYTIVKRMGYRIWRKKDAQGRIVCRVRKAEIKKGDIPQKAVK